MSLSSRLSNSTDFSRDFWSPASAKKIRRCTEKISDAVITFSRGWMAVHNPASDNPVTDALTTMEFSIAMLACRDWSNQEIADCMGLSVNTVKHIISDILATLHVNSRKELLQFVNK